MLALSGRTQDSVRDKTRRVGSRGHRVFITRSELHRSRSRTVASQVKTERLPPLRMWRVGGLAAVLGKQGGRRAKGTDRDQEHRLRSQSGRSGED